MIKLNNFISTSTIKYPLCLFRFAISARDYRLISSINLVQKGKGRKTKQPRNLPQILRFFFTNPSFVFLYTLPPPHYYFYFESLSLPFVYAIVRNIKPFGNFRSNFRCWWRKVKRESGKLHKAEVVLSRIVRGCGVAFDERDACLKFTGSCFELLYDIPIYFLLLSLLLPLSLFFLFSLVDAYVKKMAGEEFRDGGEVRARWNGIKGNDEESCAPVGFIIRRNDIAWNENNKAFHSFINKSWSRYSSAVWAGKKWRICKSREV